MAAVGKFTERNEAGMSGLRSYHAGLAAEQAVAGLYESGGYPIAARRWRGSAGEIDLVARDGSAMIFIEVKQAETFAWAAERLTERQMGRIYATASEFIANEPGGQDTEVRFDVALVDARGCIELVRNAIGH
jgi:putative endonuclease